MEDVWKYEPFLAIGRSVANLGLTVAEKLNSAERASQYSRGVEIARRETIAFDESLRYVEDPDTIDDLERKFEENTWALLDKEITHGQAKTALLESWRQIRTSNLNNVNTLKNQARVKKVFNEHQEWLTGMYNLAPGEGGGTTDQKIALEEFELNYLQKFDVYSADQAQAEREKFSHDLKQKDVSRAVWETYLAGGDWMAFLENPANWNGLDASTIQNMASEVYQRVQQKTGLDTIAAAATNKATNEDLSTKFTDLMAGNPDAMKWEDISGAEYAGDNGADLRYTWTARFSGYMKDVANAANADRESNPEVMGALISEGYKRRGTSAANITAFGKVIDYAVGVPERQGESYPGVRFGSITWQDAARLYGIANEVQDPFMSNAISLLMAGLQDYPGAAGTAVSTMYQWADDFKKDNGREPSSEETEKARQHILEFAKKPLLGSALDRTVWRYTSEGDIAFLFRADWEFQNLAETLRAAQSGELDDAATGSQDARTTIQTMHGMAFTEFSKVILPKLPAIQAGNITVPVTVSVQASDVSKATPILATTDGRFWRPWYDAKTDTISFQWTRTKDKPSSWANWTGK